MTNALTAKRAELLFQTLVRVKTRGGRNYVTPSYIETDKRKMKKVLRELTEAGWLDREDCTVVTEKIWTETPAESVDLIAEWEKSRTKGWNTRLLVPYVRLSNLTVGQIKTLVETADHFNWFLVDTDDVGFGRSGIAFHGPVRVSDSHYLGTAVSALHKTLDDKENRRFKSYELLIRTDALARYVQTTLAAERFDALYRTNLPWALTALGIASEEDAALIKTSDEPNWMFAGATRGGNLGTDPAKWGDALDEALAATEKNIERAQVRLEALTRVKDGVAAAGGWDAFRERMKTALEEELAKKKAE